jgi:HdeA/HdeB family
MTLSRPAKLVAWCVGVAAAALPIASTPAQMAIVPRTFHMEQLTCAELLGVSNERQDRFLIYFDGYLAGMRRAMTWDERVEGELIDRAIGYCKADPTQTVLSSFLKAAPR